MEDSRNTKSTSLNVGPRKELNSRLGTIEKFTSGLSKTASVGAAAGQSNDTAEFEIFQRAENWGNHNPVANKAMSLIELRRPALRHLVETD